MLAVGDGILERRYHPKSNTVRDHSEIEQYNRTLDKEFLQTGRYIDDWEVFNTLLTGWLIEYNFKRPHQSLGYLGR